MESIRSTDDVIKIWLDEYFLHLKCQSILGEDSASPVDGLVTSHLLLRKGRDNDFSMMSRWLIFASTPEGFHHEGQGVIVPHLKKALDLTEEIKPIVGAYSEWKGNICSRVALEKVEKLLRIAMLSLCCTQMRYDLASDLCDSMHRDDMAEIPSSLLLCIRKGMNHNSADDLESLRLAILEFVREFVLLLPKPSLILMAEKLVFSGSEDLGGTVAEEYEGHRAFEIPPFQLICLPKHMQELHERGLNAWSKRLTDSRSELNERVKALGLRERLSAICDRGPSSTNNNVNNDGIDCNARATGDGNVANMNEDDCLESDNDSLARIFGETANGENALPRSPEAMAAANVEGDEVCNAVCDIIQDESGSEEIRHVLQPRKKRRRHVIYDDEDDNFLKNEEGNFKTSTQKDSESLTQSSGRSLTHMLRRPPLNHFMVDRLSPIKPVSGQPKSDGGFGTPRGAGTISETSFQAEVQLGVSSRPPEKGLSRSSSSEKSSPSTSEAKPSSTGKKRTKPSKLCKLHSDHMLLPSDTKEASEELSTGSVKMSDNTLLLNQLRVGSTARNLDNPGTGRNGPGRMRKVSPLRIAKVEPDARTCRATRGGVKTSTPRKADETDSLLEFGRDRPKKAKRTRWSEEEENELIEAVRLFTPGRWADMLATGKFPGRSNVDLKDKWRNMTRKDPSLLTM